MERLSKCKGLTVLLVISFLISASGCATYSTAQIPMRPISYYVNSVGKGGLTIGAENLYTPAKSKLYFDVDLTKKGIVPVCIAMSNRGGEDYIIESAECKLIANNIDGEISAIPLEDAVVKMRKGSVGKAIGWSLIVPIIAIPVAAVSSAVHTKGVNVKMEQDVRSKAFQTTLLRKDDMAQGVVFFELPRPPQEEKSEETEHPGRKVKKKPRKKRAKFPEALTNGKLKVVATSADTRRKVEFVIDL